MLMATPAGQRQIAGFSFEAARLPAEPRAATLKSSACYVLMPADAAVRAGTHARS